MSPKTLNIAAIAVISAFAALSNPAVAAGDAFRIGRAINIAQWYTWPRYEAAGSQIMWPPYKTQPRPPSLADLKALRQAGFDTVRLPVDPAPFIVFEGERRAEVYAMLFEGIARINAAGLRVIVDIHPNSRHPVWGQDAIAVGPDSRAFRAVADVVEDMARRLKPLGGSAALELLNEPRLKCKGADQAKWQEMVLQLVTRARAANPGLTLIATGACISAPEGLIALDPKPFDDANILYTFHYYEPFSFTHQGAQFIPWPDKYLDGVPWPAAAAPIAEASARIDEHMKAVTGVSEEQRLIAHLGAKHNLKKYYASGADAGLVRRRFAQIAGWAKNHGIAANRIFIGEFGVVKRQPGKPGAFCADRARWHRDVVDAADEAGFSWGYFSYDGPFGLAAEDAGRALDPVILGSLKLGASCRFAAPNSGEGASKAALTSCLDLCPKPDKAPSQ